MEDTSKVLQAQQAQAAATAPESVTKQAPTKQPAKEFAAEKIANERLNTMEDLRKLNKDLYQTMLEGIGQQILSQMRRGQRRIKDAIRRGRQQ